MREEKKREESRTRDKAPRQPGNQGKDGKERRRPE
jgi:hypothetical protein